MSNQDYWSDDEAYDILPRVCLTHRRVNICKHESEEDPCVWSEGEEDLKEIYNYQKYFR